MPRPDLVDRLVAIGERGACSDAERRACLLLREELRARGRPARMEAAWVRPQWPQSWALHCALGVAGSLVAVGVPAVGLGILVATLVSFVLDVTGRAHLLRLIFPRRATQVVVSSPPASEKPVRLVLAASVDAPRTGAIFGDYTTALGRARRALRGHLSAPPAWLALTMLVLAGFAGARLAGAGGQVLGAVQLVPTVVLLLAAGALVDVALSRPSPGANADASAVAAVLEIADALDADPPRALDVEVVLAGAGDGLQLGMRSYVRGRPWPAEEVAVLALGPCGAGRPHVFATTGLLIPLKLHPRLLELAGRAPRATRHVGPALPARSRRWPAIAVAGLDELGRAPHARQASDTPDQVRPAAIDATVDLCLGLITRLDRDLSPSAETSSAGLTDR